MYSVMHYNYNLFSETIHVLYGWRISGANWRPIGGKGRQPWYDEVYWSLYIKRGPYTDDMCMT